MSETFDIQEYLNSQPDWMGKKRNRVPLVMPTLYQSSDEDEDKDVMDRFLLRHLRPVADTEPDANTQPIVIRQVRHITGPLSVSVRRVVMPAHNATRNIVVKAVRPYTKKSRTTCYWQDAGWEKRDGYLIGNYTAGGESFAGSIELLDSVVTPGKYYIYDPPDEVLKGSHGSCFRFEQETVGGRKYWVHFSEEPVDIDSGIVQIQRDMTDSMS